MERSKAPRSWLDNPGTYRRLALATLIAGFGLIVFGGVVRITESGMGCGPDWPHCNGAIIPSYSYETAIEFTHRVLAAGVMVMTFGLIVLGRRQYAPGDALRVLPVIAMVLVLAQALLGAVTVVLEIPPSVVTAHLGMAQAYFAVVLVLTLLARYDIRASMARLRQVALHGWNRIASLAIIAAALVFLLMLSGAYTATRGAGYACPEWPLCEGRYVPTGWTVIDIHLSHRWLALFATVAIVIIAWQSLRMFQSATIRRVAVLSLVVMLLQIVVGAANIWFELHALASGAHLAVATIIWGLLILLASLIRLEPMVPLQSRQSRLASGSNRETAMAGD